MKKFKSILALLLLGGLVATGCGNKDKNSSGDGTQQNDGGSQNNNSGGNGGEGGGGNGGGNGGQQGEKVEANKVEMNSHKILVLLTKSLLLNQSLLYHKLRKWKQNTLMHM